MNDPSYAADGYAIIQSVKLDGMEFVVAENPNANKHYMCWRRSLGVDFGSESHFIPVYNNDYLIVMREFVRQVSSSIDSLDLGRVYRGSPLQDFAFSAEYCVPGGMDVSLVGKVIAIKAEAFSPEYRSASFQIMLCTGGFGAQPGARGSAVFCTNIYSGETVRWERYDVLGVVAPQYIPKWAKEKLAKLDAKENPAEQESVIAKIRAAEKLPKPERRPKKGHKSHDEEL